MTFYFFFFLKNTSNQDKKSSKNQITIHKIDNEIINYEIHHKISYEKDIFKSIIK